MRPGLKAGTGSLRKAKSLTLFFIITMVLAALLSSCAEGTGLMPGTGFGQGKDVTLFIASDIHYIDKDMYDNGPAFRKYMQGSNGRNFLYIDEVIRAFATEVEEQKPDVLVISGDLTNNGEKINHKKVAELLKQIEDASGTKIYVIPGNHDIENPWARRFRGDKAEVAENISPEQFAEIYAEFGYGEALSRDEFTLSYLVAPSEKLWLIMLDTNLYYLNTEAGSPTVGGALMVETLEWMEDCAKMARENDAEIITVSHHNLLKHSENRFFGYTVGQNERAVAVYEKLGIPLNLSGHIHAQSVKFHEYEGGKLYDIATGTMSSFPTRYAVLKFEPGKGFSYDTFSVDVEKWAKNQGLKDENLLNFSNYSRSLYLEDAYDRYYAGMEKEGRYPEQDISEMARTMSLISAARFSGRAEGNQAVIDEIRATPGYEIWLKYDSEFSNLLNFKNAGTIFVEQNL